MRPAWFCIVTIVCLASSLAATVLPQSESDSLGQPGPIAQSAAPDEDVLKIAIVGGSVGEGLAWRSLMGFSPDNDPIRFASTQLGRRIHPREFELRTDSISFAEILDALAVDDRVEIATFASQIVITRTVPNLHRQLQRCVRDEIDIAFGVDFLFWTAYGPVAGAKSADERAARQLAAQAEMFTMIDRELGETNIELVIGDYPSIERVPELLVPRAARPTAATLTELNRRLAEFTAERPRVHVLSMFAPLRDAYAGTLPAEVGGERRLLFAAQTLQLDDIHPNRLGMAYLTADFLVLARAKFERFAAVFPATTFERLIEFAGAEPGQLDELAKLAPRVVPESTR